MLLFLLACLLQAYAIPVSTGPQTSPTLAHIIVWGIEPRDDASGLGERTMLTIIRSCLLTIAACVYRAIHQNIPDPKATWWERQRIRIKITFYAVLVPEAVIWWAMRQWFGAREVAKQINGLNVGLVWTTTHGYFAQMGGLGRLDDGRVLHPPTLIKLLKSRQIDIAELKRVTKERIEDKSKGDILSKGIVALQTTWFVFECLTRLHQKLPLLELEVVTLAFAVLNTLTYLFWWDKPLNVLCPIYLHILPPPQADDLPASATSLDEPSSQGQPAANIEEIQPLLAGYTTGSKQEAGGTDTRKAVKGSGWLIVTKETLLAFAWWLWGLFTRPVHFIWTDIWAGIKVVEADIKVDGWLVTGWKWLIKEPFKMVGEPIGNLFFDEYFDEKATHVEMFYGMENSDGKGTASMLLSCLIGTIFGAIHFLSWHSSFPTHTQLVFWRISTIVLVAQPFSFFVEALLGGYSLIGLGLIAYLFARFSILVLAFLTLRDLPPHALETISWTTYIPHF